MTSKMGLARSISTQKLKSLASPVLDFRKGVLNSIFGHWTLTSPFLGVFLMLEMRLAEVYP